MYVVLLSYTAPQTEIDYRLPEHTDWIARQYEHGLLLASGRRPGHQGEVLIARPVSLGKLEATVATDPLVLNELVDHEIIEFSATRTGPELREVNEAVPH
ncbi:YciI family protein [Saccharomonospora halophila]|uniref:YciI family protein n=1 Tax=Saccharomonospora halophila TaxID=129922 RepID=UPI00037BF8E6|nr:YciI family protein [Saccharomonospora halophila]